MTKYRNKSGETDMISIPRSTYDRLCEQRRELILDNKDLQRTALNMGNDMKKLLQEYGNTCAVFLQLSAMYFNLVDAIKKCSGKALNTGDVWERMLRDAEQFFNGCADPGTAGKTDPAKNASEGVEERERDDPDGPDEDEDGVTDDFSDVPEFDCIPSEVRRILARYQNRR